MKIQNKEYSIQGNKVTLSEIAISLLRDFPSGGGIEASKKQIVLSEKLKDSDGELNLTPEDASLIRSLLDRPNILLAPGIQVDMYDSLDPEGIRN